MLYVRGPNFDFPPQGATSILLLTTDLRKCLSQVRLQLSKSLEQQYALSHAKISARIEPNAGLLMLAKIPNKPAIGTHALTRARRRRAEGKRRGGSGV